MIESDFRECEYIDKYMRFYSYKEFCDLKLMILARYKLLNINAKQFYKWYVYANPNINYTLKNAIWDYLNGFDDGRNLMLLRRKMSNK